jgi:hypothetical protein
VLQHGDGGGERRHQQQQEEAARVIDGNPISVEHAEIMDMLKAIANKVEYAEAKGE